MIANDTSGFEEARAVMAGADVVVLIVGTDNQVEREGIDRASVTLPGVQEQLAQLAVASGKPVVAILVNGGPLDVTYLKNNADSILEAWYPGEQGGNGVADVVFGTYSPSGKLPALREHQLGRGGGRGVGVGWWGWWVGKGEGWGWG